MSLVWMPVDAGEKPQKQRSGLAILRQVVMRVARWLTDRIR
ncbi:MAG TPA: hypothetical protein VK335_34245 [Bryobacteraceae bacterium]|nr:hypothetical protein [Bryobacteraceae bacterium]